MANFQLAIQGEDALEAIESLFKEIPEISGDWETVEGSRKDMAVVDAIANLASITGVSMGILAQQIFYWYQKCKNKKSGKRVEKVVIICGNGTRRIMMLDASVEDIQRFLEDC